MDIDEGQIERGFDRIEFRDYYGAACSLQYSSLATDQAIWLGVDRDEYGNEMSVRDDGLGNAIPGGRMHLTRSMVAELLPYLQRFVTEGRLK